jgi:ketosteroid isomerase-like protein
MQYGLRMACGLAICTLPASAATADPTAALDPELGAFLADFEKGTERFMNGEPAPWKANASQRDDVMIMGAWGAYEKGWTEASARYDWAAARFRDADAELEVENIGAFASGDLAVVTAIERATVKLAGQAEAAPMALRVTHAFRREDGAWKLVLRHADPLVAKTAPETVLKK